MGARFCPKRPRFMETILAMDLASTTDTKSTAYTALHEKGRHALGRSFTGVSRRAERVEVDSARVHHR